MTTKGSLWDKVASNLQEWYADAREWTGEKARIGVKKVDMVGIQHNIKRTMTHLGGRVYDLVQRGEDVAMDVEVKRLVATIRGFENELAEREREIDELKVRRQDESAATVGTPGDTAGAASETVATPTTSTAPTASPASDDSASEAPPRHPDNP